MSWHRRRPAWAAGILLLGCALGTTGCTPANTCPPSPTGHTIHLHDEQARVTSIECWDGCGDEGRDSPAAAEGAHAWSLVITGEPPSVTIATRNAEGQLLYVQRFGLPWREERCTVSVPTLELDYPNAPAA